MNLQKSLIHFRYRRHHHRIHYQYQTQLMENIMMVMIQWQYLLQLFHLLIEKLNQVLIEKLNQPLMAVGLCFFNLFYQNCKQELLVLVLES